MFLLPFLAALIFPANAAAAACAPLSELHGSINFCSQNPGYIPPAADCRNSYRAYVNRKYPQVRKQLAALAAGAQSAQHLEFNGQQGILASTDATLADLIARGRQVLHELDAYGDDMVPPTPSWAAGYRKPNWRDPADPAREPSTYCYAEPAGDLEQIFKDVQKMVDDLTAAKAETDRLHGDTSGRNENLASLSESAGARIGVPSGKAPFHESRVTGKSDRLGLATSLRRPMVKRGLAVAPADSRSPQASWSSRVTHPQGKNSAGAGHGIAAEPSAKFPAEATGRAAVAGAPGNSQTAAPLEGAREAQAGRSEPSSAEGGPAGSPGSEAIAVAALLREPQRQPASSGEPSSAVASTEEAVGESESPLSAMITTLHSTPENQKAAAEASISEKGGLVAANPEITLFDRIHRALRQRASQLRP